MAQARPAPGSDSTSQREPVLGIFHLNFDCYPDTVLGTRTDAGYLPKRILWGAPMADSSGKIDTACLGRTPLKKRVRQTTITYPGSGALDGSVAFQRVNPDTLTDMVIHLYSKYRENGNGKERDSLRSLVVFGQHGLNAVPVIHISDIRRFQADPFFAMDLIKGSELTKPGTRDLSGRTSYVLEPIDISMNDRDSLPPPIVAPIAGVDYREQGNGAATMGVHPNPAGSTVMIEAAGLQTGIHTIELVSVNGSVELREEARSGQGGRLARELDVRRVPNGYYVVRIENATGDVIATYPIIITR